MREKLTNVSTILESVEDARSSDDIKQAILVTAPHAADKINPRDDPCTRSVALSLCSSIVRSLINVPCDKFVASRARTTYEDQNRLAGLVKANDLYPKLQKYLQKKNNNLGDVLHVDIHSFQPESKKLPKGWGRGINILYLLGDKKQQGFAQRMADCLNTSLRGRLPKATVVEHPKLPLKLDDKDSNAMIEWSRHYGALGVLVELPVEIKSGVWELACSQDELVSAITHALKMELSNPPAREGGGTP